jgi:hypothetical protein
VSIKFFSLTDSGLSGGKDIKLERIISRVGGTQGEIDAFSLIRSITRKAAYIAMREYKRKSFKHFTC